MGNEYSRIGTAWPLRSQQFKTSNIWKHYALPQSEWYTQHSCISCGWAAVAINFASYKFYWQVHKGSMSGRVEHCPLWPFWGANSSGLRLCGTFEKHINLTVTVAVYRIVPEADEQNCAAGQQHEKHYNKQVWFVFNIAEECLGLSLNEYSLNGDGLQHIICHVDIIVRHEDNLDGIGGIFRLYGYEKSENATALLYHVPQRIVEAYRQWMMKERQNMAIGNIWDSVCNDILRVPLYLT